ncbi:MAG: proline dehydrogenase family protein, partial [Chloroflexi bacterium]|nr:proline dehydrogenase family protein [Chloroflexota bacterium]
MSISSSVTLEDEVRRIGNQIVAAAGNDESSIHPADWFDGRIMEWAMADEALKVQLFRFIDVLPTLRSSDEVARHLEEYFTSPGSHSPVAAQWGIHLAAHHPVAARAAALMVRTNAERMAGRFIAGADLPSVIKTLRRLRRQHMGFTVDLLGEASVNESEAAAYEERYRGVIDGLCDEAAGWKPDTVLDTGPFGAVPRVNVSVKLSSLYSQMDPGAPEFSSLRIRERLRPLLSLASQRGAAVTIDMEQYSLKSLTIQVFREILDEPEFAGWGHCGIALQAYLRETEQDVRELVAWASRRSDPVGVRLVRGAYWDYETVIASQRGWPVPVFTRKVETDLSYERCLRLLLEAYPHVQTAAASHNVRSLALCMALCEELGLPSGAAEIQMLYGMADPIKKAIVERGWRLRVYTPFGDLLPGMAYLVRRLLENTSNSSFLRMRFNESVPV